MAMLPLDPERLKEDVRARIRRHFSVPAAAPVPSAAEPRADLASVRLAIQEASRACSQTGALPPVPATPRGRIGAWLVQAVRRALFWYTPQILRFQNAAIRALEEQLSAIEQISGAAQHAAALAQQAMALAEGSQRLIGEDRQERIASLAREVTGLRSTITDLRDDASRAVSRLSEVETQIAELPVRSLEAVQSASSELRREMESRDQALQAGMDTLARQSDDSQTALKSMFAAEVAARDEQAAGLTGQIAAARHELYRLKSQLAIQDRRLGLLLEEARKRLPEPFDADQMEVFAGEEKHQMDALYTSFEDIFRGSREEIRERLRIYLPLLKERGLGTPALPILDTGCGRGEWLELLRDEGLTARGVDHNRIMVSECRDLGLEVSEADVLEHLRSLPPASLGALTGFHIIEHLPLDVLIRVLDETVRVLKPAGLALFETPNPENVLVGSHTFYMDPTHRNPLPANMMRFLVEARGLCHVEIRHANPYPPGAAVPDGSPLAERFNAYFYGPQDYAVIGVKA